MYIWRTQNLPHRHFRPANLVGLGRQITEIADDPLTPHTPLRSPKCVLPTALLDLRLRI